MKLLLLFLVFAAVACFAQQTHSATLTWTDTANPAGTTYDVYRATGACPASGLGSLTFAVLNTSPIAAKTYADTTVAASTTYCYYVTAVGSSGSQSAPSGTVQGTIPGTFPPNTPTIVVQ